MEKKKEIVDIGDKQITSRDIINLVGHLVGIFVFAKKLWDSYNEKKH